LNFQNNVSRFFFIEDASANFCHSLSEASVWHDERLLSHMFAADRSIGISCRVDAQRMALRLAAPHPAGLELARCPHGYLNQWAASAVGFVLLEAGLRSVRRATTRRGRRRPRGRGHGRARARVPCMRCLSTMVAADDVKAFLERQPAAESWSSAAMRALWVTAEARPRRSPLSGARRWRRRSTGRGGGLIAARRAARELFGQPAGDGGVDRIARGARPSRECRRRRAVACCPSARAGCRRTRERGARISSGRGCRRWRRPRGSWSRTRSLSRSRAARVALLIVKIATALRGAAWPSA
jgi:hypothetical protein